MRANGIRNIIVVLSLACSVAVAGEAKEAGESSVASPQAQSAAPPEAGGEAASPAGPPKTMPRVVMARVGDQDITVDEFMKYVSKDARLVQQATTDAGRAAILKDLIEQRLLVEAIRREGLVGDDPERPLNQKDLAAGYQSLMQKHFPMPAEPTDQEAYEYYMQHQEQYGIPETVRVSQIQFRVPRNATQAEREEARARAEAALKRLEAGEPFEQVAAAVTENRRAKVASGDLGFLPLKRDPWLAKSLEGLKPGQHTGVLESPVGFEILKLTDHREALIAPYANVRDRILASMRLEGQNLARERYFGELAKQVGVTIEMPELQAAMP